MAATLVRQSGSEELPAPAYVVLGMIRLGCRSGYEIKQAVEISIRFFWTISHAQIYPSLALLEERGLVRGRDEPRGRRRRRVFDISERGEQELERWLRQAQPIPFELRDIGLVKLFFADALPEDDALRLVRAVAERSRERVETLRSVEAEAEQVEQDGNVYPMLTLRIGIAFHQAMVNACREFEAR